MVGIKPVSGINMDHWEKQQVAWSSYMTLGSECEKSQVKESFLHGLHQEDKRGCL